MFLKVLSKCCYAAFLELSYEWSYGISIPDTEPEYYRLGVGCGLKVEKDVRRLLVKLTHFSVVVRPSFKFLLNQFKEQIDAAR